MPPHLPAFKQFTALQLAHPFADERWAIPDLNALRVAGREKLDRLAIYECYFRQIEAYGICFLRHHLFDQVQMPLPKISANMKKS